MSKQPKKTETKSRGRPRLGTGLARPRSFYVADEEWERWLSVAESQEISISELIRRAMERECKRK